MDPSEVPNEPSVENQQPQPQGRGCLENAVIVMAVIIVILVIVLIAAIVLRTL